MSNQTTDATVKMYLPAVFQPTTEPGPIERLLTKPLRRERAARQRAR